MWVDPPDPLEWSRISANHSHYPAHSVSGFLPGVAQFGPTRISAPPTLVSLGNHRLNGWFRWIFSILVPREHILVYSHRVVCFRSHVIFQEGPDPASIACQPVPALLERGAGAVDSTEIFLRIAPTLLCWEPRYAARSTYPPA